MKRTLTSCLGLGFLPVAPGTWGSLPPAAVFIILNKLDVPTPVIFIVMLVLALIGSVICVKFAPEIISKTGKDDPREIVADEFAGQSVTFLLFTLICKTNIFIAGGVGFGLFRLFDVIKPWPIRKLEKFPKGWGILTDDLLAGLYAAISLVAVTRLLN